MLAREKNDDQKGYIENYKVDAVEFRWAEALTNEHQKGRHEAYGDEHQHHQLFGVNLDLHKKYT